MVFFSIFQPEPVRPGPADYSLTKANLRKTPMFSNRQKTKPSYPESLNYTAKGIQKSICTCTVSDISVYMYQTHKRPLHLRSL